MSPQYYHGTGSGSLVGVLDKKKPGLKPLGVLLKEGGITYNGELGGGIEKKGASYVGLSGVPPDQLRYAVKYALYKGNRPWNPNVGKAELWVITELQKNRIYETLDRIIFERFGNVRLDLFTLERLSEYGLRKRKAITEKRVESWKKLSPSKKNLISELFPVIYGFDYEGETITANSPYYDEVIIRDVIHPRELEIYVSHREIKRVKRMLRGISSRTKVVSYASLRRKSLPQNAHDSIDDLLRETKSQRNNT